MHTFTLESAKRFEQLEKLVEAKDKELERQREQQIEREERREIERQLHSARGENRMLLKMAETVANHFVQQSAQPGIAMPPPYHYGMQHGYGGHALMDAPHHTRHHQGRAPGRKTVLYKGEHHEVHVGPKGGKFIIVDGRKIYLSQIGY